ncbi:acyltransferase family protein [Terrisporobacter hibernicus]|uniref:Acyltransferase n=1 Tax=Terrisporobacter hibernicus TaxID=2813371 RepID=A0AAX2ZJZ7_9FIRM|nr:acyltransferase [Terrisporobacter hibernicus]UEL48687.1 acyltransferase [Terrisporobacter hibernicus]
MLTSFRKWGTISTYRNEIYGISIISIIIFHYFEDIAGAIEINKKLLLISNIYNLLIKSIGVEIFLFMSGICLWFSLKKNENIRCFYLKRFKRVLVPYFILGIIFWFIKDIVILNENIYTYFNDLFLLSFWFDGNKNFWFIAFILLTYILYPFLFFLFNREDKQRKITLVLMLTLITSFIIFIKIFNKNIYLNLEIALYRLIIFVLGTYFAKKVYEDAETHIEDKIFYLCGLIIKIAVLIMGIYNITLIKLFNNRIMNSISAVSYTILISCVFNYLFYKKNFVSTKKILTLFGEYSLELYLTHVSIRTIFNLVGLVTYDIFNYGICIIISIFLSIILKKITNYVDNCLFGEVYYYG